MIQLYNGSLTLGHRPGHLTILKMNDQFTHVVTLVSKREQADDIGHQVKKAQMRWTHMPLWHVWDENPEKIFGYALGVIKLLKEGERIYLHCSAGIHRTGTVSYFILRESGYTHERALELIIHERPVVETELKMALSHMDLTYMKVKKAEAKRLGREVK